MRSLYTMFINNYLYKVQCLFCQNVLSKMLHFSTCFFMGILNVSHVDGYLYIGE